MTDYSWYNRLTREFIEKEFDFWPEQIDRPKLKPCPYCNKPAVSFFDFVDFGDDPGGGNCFFAGCPDCGIIYHGLWFPKYAAEEWNSYCEEIEEATQDFKQFLTEHGFILIEAENQKQAKQIYEEWKEG